MSLELTPDQFDYFLPEGLIAQNPSVERDQSRLMILDRFTGQFKHAKFNQLLTFQKPGDVLVMNQSRVIPARLYATNLDLDRPVEMLLLRKIEDGVWKALVKPGRRLKVGSRYETSRENNDEVISGKVLSIEPDGERIISLQ